MTSPSFRDPGRTTVMSNKRDAYPYTWYVSCGMSVYAALAGVRFDRLFGDLDAIVQAFTVGEPKARELFGPDVQYGGPAWAGISYGHVNCLGVPLIFLPDTEVGQQPIYDSLEQGVDALQQPVDWANAGRMPDYLGLWEALQSAFPDRKIPFGGFGLEGPITTAWELRGHGFFTDLYDHPDLCREYLRLVTDSVVDYAAYVRKLNGQPAFVNGRIGLYDDVASLVHPDMWPAMVLPYHERFFCRQTSGLRHAHIENLTPAHIPYLDALHLDSFDPSVATGIEPHDLRDGCQVPFLWRLNSMQVRDMSEEQICRFVYDAVRDGASGTFCAIGRTMIEPSQVPKVHAYMDAARQVGQLLDEGIPREHLHRYL